MRRVLLLLTLLLVAFIAINRQRIYLRDPLASVERDAVQVKGARVFINYSNDILVQTGSWTRMEQFVVQGWNREAGVPAVMRCVQGMACLAETDRVPIVETLSVGEAAMSSREVSFNEQDRTTISVRLR